MKCPKCGKRVPKVYKKAHETYHANDGFHYREYSPEYKAWTRKARKQYAN